MVPHTGKYLKGMPWLANPFVCRLDSLPVNLVLMVKLIALGLLIKGYLFDLSYHFLPFWPVFEHLGSPGRFNDVLQFFFIVGVAGILFSRSIRLFSFILGTVMLVTVLSSQAEYSNVKFFCSCVLILTAVADRRDAVRFLRYQLAIVYLGSWVNKIFDPDWRSGQYFEHWMSNIVKRDLYVSAASLLPSMLLSKIMCWATIVTEFFLSIGFLFRSLWQAVILTGVYFHSTAFLMAWRDFGAFTIAILASYLILVTWPQKIEVSYDGTNRLHRWIKNVFERTDWDGRLVWQKKRGVFKTEISGQACQGLMALKYLILWSPFSYFCYAVFLGLPNEQLLFFKLKTVQLVLVLFFPYLELFNGIRGLRKGNLKKAENGAVRGVAV